MKHNLPGAVHHCHDAILTAAELADITDPSELALCAGISKPCAAAAQRHTRATTKQESTP